MIRLYSWIILFLPGIFAQDTYRNVASTLRECYENRYLLEKDNRLPHTLNTLIAILEKIENTENLNMDLQSLTIGIMHRFRQDGIEKNPTVLQQSGVLPYRAAGQAQKYLQILRFIPEKTIAPYVLPYDIISDIERCTLHFMLSSSIEIFERGDEGTVCRYADNAYRYARSVDNNHSINTNFNIPDEVETLTPEQIGVITNHKNGITEDTVDPNAFYPELPPNHPKNARLLAFPPRSRCPVENGVIKTNWGPVSAGPLIAGIAAGLQPEIVELSKVFPNESPERKANLSKLLLDNRWIATLAGDLAEVTLIQGPTNEKLSVGVNGNWNSSFVPRWYFLNSNEKLQFTTAEIRGDLDGLILANEIESLYSKIPTLKLSQILNMYYSTRGLLNPSIRACNRKTLFTTLTGNSTLSMQTYSASLVLEEYLHKATMDDDVTKRFAMQAANELSQYIHSSMNKDPSCQDAETGSFNNVIQIAVDLTIIIDTTWPFDLIQPIIANILDKMEINRYNSQYTIINGHDSSIIINTTNSILDFGYYNITNYKNVSSSSSPFDLAKLLEKLISLQKKKLDDERYGLGQAKSNVVLIIPYQSSVPDTDKEYCIEQIKKMREQVPDTVLLILTYGSKDRWSDFVSNPISDLFSTTAVDNIQGASTIVDLILRIKQVPQRLINTQCGADYSVVGSSNSFIDYIEPATMVSYKLHPNYFFSSDSDHISTIKIEGSDWGNLKVCTSRHFINFNATEDTSVSCASISSDSHTVTFSCDEAGLIHLCNPLYLSITANSSVTNYQCTDTRICRFPHMIKYTISYENLVCVSSAHINMLSISVLIISTIYIFL
ncbi:N-acetylmuramoyl-L-alanine amidase [Formica fusca]